MSIQGKNKHKELSGIMQDNLKNLSSQMVKIKQKNGKISSTSRPYSEFETIPDALSSTDREERLKRPRNRERDTSPMKLEIYEKASANYESDKYDPLFPEYAEYDIDIDTGNPGSRRVYRLGDEIGGNKNSKIPVVEENHFDNNDMDYEVLKDNYYQEKSINPNEFFPKPFVVISCNNKLNSHKKEDDDFEELSVKSMLEAPVDDIFSPQRTKNVRLTQALEELAEKNDELNSAFETYQTHIQSNYKKILLQNTYGELKEFPDEVAKNESPSKANLKYNQYIPLSREEKLASSKKKPQKKIKKESGKKTTIYKYPDYKNTPVRTKSPRKRVSSSGYKYKTPGSVRQSARKSSARKYERVGDGYGDSIDDVAGRMKHMEKILYQDEIRGDKKKFLQCLKNLDKFFKSQFQQVLRTNAELKNFSKMIKRKNKNLEVVLGTIDNETDKLESNLRLVTKDTKRLYNLLEDREYYEEIGHKKIQKMNELEEMRRVVKDLNRRFEEKKRELKERKRTSKNLQKLYQQIQGTFTSNNKALKKALKKGKRQGRIRDLVNQRSFSSTGTSFKRKKKKLGLRIRNRPKTTKKRSRRKTSTSKKLRNYSGPFINYDASKMDDEQRIEIDLKETRDVLLQNENDLRKQGIRIYPMEDDFERRMKRPLNHLKDNSPVLKAILRQELIEGRINPDGIDLDRIYNSHQDGPIVRNHLINNPVSYHEKKMRSKVMKAMNF